MRTEKWSVNECTHEALTKWTIHCSKQEMKLCIAFARKHDRQNSLYKIRDCCLGKREKWMHNQLGNKWKISIVIFVM